MSTHHFSLPRLSLASTIVISLCAISTAASPWPSSRVNSGKEQIIFSKLDSETRIELIDDPLSSSVEYLSERHRIPVVIDEAALVAAGITSDVPINVHARNVALRSALQLILDPLGLTYAVRNDVLLITSDRSSNAYDVRSYNVAAIVGASGDVERLAELISNQIVDEADFAAAEEGFGRRGGPRLGGGLRVNAFDKSLVIRATDVQHGQVERILGALAESKGIDREAPFEHLQPELPREFAADDAGEAEAEAEPESEDPFAPDSPFGEEGTDEDPFGL